MLLDISQVTKALQNLLTGRIETSPGWVRGKLNVSALPPDRLKDVDNVLGTYMFHLTEDPHFKNAPPAGTATPPVATTPMTLQLYYIITANSKHPDEEASYFEQQVMGLAVKTLRDTPLIDDTTTAGSPASPVLPLSIRGQHNRVRMTLEPVSYTDAPHFWTAGQQPLRLAAYYQVSATMLEPEPSSRFAPPVLRYGVYAFARNGPRLDTSASTVTFIAPDDGIARDIDVRPAEVPIGGSVRFGGSDLRGEVTTLTLSYPFWDAPIDADALWNVTATDDEVRATVRPAIGTPPQTIVPGVYSATVTVRETRQLPDGSFRRFEQVSNATPFSIAPRIDSNPVVFGALNIAAIVGAGFAGPPLVKAENVVVLLGFNRLARSTAMPIEPGTFHVADDKNLTFRLSGTETAGERLMLRVFVNGVESAPLWVTVPP